MKVDGWFSKALVFPISQAAPMLVRSRSDADRMQSVQRALDGLTSKVLEVQMDEGQQHDICDLDSTTFRLRT